MEAGRPDDPTDLREGRAEVHEVRAIAQRGRARGRRGSGPQVVWHDVATACNELDLLAGGAVQRQLQAGVRDAALRCRPRVVIVGWRRERFPGFAEEERWPHRHRPSGFLGHRQGYRRAHHNQQSRRPLSQH